MHRFNPNYKDDSHPSGYWFICPGCAKHFNKVFFIHKIWVFEYCPETNSIWSAFLGNGEHVTESNHKNDLTNMYFNPSVLINEKTLKIPGYVCHSFIRPGGVIEYLDDCTHPLKNQSVQIPLWDLSAKEVANE